MDWLTFAAAYLTFLASVIGALAWPVTIALAGYHFRRELHLIFGQPLTHARVGIFGFSWRDAPELIGEKVGATGATTATGAAGATGPGATGTPIGAAGAAGQAQAVIAIKQARTPEELAERVAQYVERRTPGVRGLSEERRRLETELFGVILEFQDLLARRFEPSGPMRAANVATAIDQFWAHPEQLADQDVEDTTTLVRTVIDEMRAAGPLPLG